MNIGSLFGFGGGVGIDPKSTELINIFPLSIAHGSFVKTDVINLYTRILTDVLERTEGIADKDQKLLWDNCLASESSDGLVTMLAKAMADKTELYLVYNKAIGLIVKATPEQQAQIKEDYKKSAESKNGVYISFGKYERTDMIKFYSGLEYSVVGALSKQMNLAMAIQLKMNDLRASVSLMDSGKAAAQGTAIAEGLALGKDVMLDGKDIIETSKPDLTATNSAMEFVNQKRSLYLGLPASWITGVGSKGLSDTGKGDSKAIARGLKNYFFAIIKPVCETLLGVDLSFDDEDYDLILTANQTLTTFEATSEALLSADNKRKIINRQYGLPDSAKGDPIPVTPPPPPVVPPVKA